VTHYWRPANGTTPAAPLGSPRVLAKPDLAATDGALTTFFIGTTPPFRFFGTSAAAPHAAAVAALMLDGFPDATVAQIRSAQKGYATAVGTAGPLVVGRGLVDARKSVAALLPGISINNVTKTEGNIGKKSFTFTLTLAKPSAAVVSVRATTQPGTASAGSDFVARIGTVTFQPGQTTRAFIVQVQGNTVVEDTEAFTVKLSTSNHCKLIDATGVGTINNDD
jgi:subtilisin family serine protease